MTNYKLNRLWTPRSERDKEVFISLYMDDMFDIIY